MIAFCIPLVVYADTGIALKTPVYEQPAAGLKIWQRQYFYQFHRAHQLLTVDWSSVGPVRDLVISNIDLTQPKNAALHYSTGDTDYIFDSGNPVIKKLYQFKNSKNAQDADYVNLLQTLNIVSTDIVTDSEAYYWIPAISKNNILIPRKTFVVEALPTNDIYYFSLPSAWTQAHIETFKKRVVQDFSELPKFMSVQHFTPVDENDSGYYLVVDFNVFR